MTAEARAVSQCPRCQAAVSASDRFCTECGKRLDADAADEGQAFLVECTACGAANAASRIRCAACRTALVANVPVTPIPAYPPAAADSPRSDGEPSTMLLATVLLVGLFAAGALGAAIFSRLLPATTPPPVGAAATLPVTSARASSEVEGGDGLHAAAAAVDGDPTTAWAGAGVGEWLEVELPADASVHRIVVHNGWQAPDRFDALSRARRVRIEAGERTFAVALLDLPGPQVVDLPEAVMADRLRLVIESIYGADGSLALAISEVAVQGAQPQSSPSS